MLSGILFSVSSIGQNRIEGIWNRTILAGVKTSEILVVNIFILLVNDVLQVLIFNASFKVIFDMKVEGNELALGLIYFLLCVTGNSIGLTITILTNSFSVISSAGIVIFFICGGLGGGFW
jgi:hypothetical protein